MEFEFSKYMKFQEDTLIATMLILREINILIKIIF